MVISSIIGKAVVSTIDVLLLLAVLYSMKHSSNQNSTGSELFAVILTAFNIIAIWI